jgi:DNA-binding NarL/FixJ family response regulator
VKRIRVMLIEDNRLLREGLAAMLAEQPSISVVGATGNPDAIGKVKQLKPTVVLLDIGLRKHSLHVVQSLQRTSPTTRIIVMDLAPVQTDLYEYVEAGVSGFVLRDATFDDFLATIRTVAEGGKVLPPALTESLFSQIVDHATQRKKHLLLSAVRMTRREREVIDLIAEGLSNKEIAKRLYLATDTVKGHVHNILEKLALHTRLEIASYAHKADNPQRRQR